MNSIVEQENFERAGPSYPNPPTTEAKMPCTSDRSQKAPLGSEWHDAKEIVLPFDDRGFSGLLVSEKEFAAAYAPKQPPPPFESLRLEAGRTVGLLLGTPSLPQRVGQVAVTFLGLFEKLLMAWPPVLLLTAIPLPGWWSFILTGVWIAMLWVFYRFGSRFSVSLLVWMISILATSAWLYHTPLMISCLSV